jgi:hypothetical protein
MILWAIFISENPHQDSTLSPFGKGQTEDNFSYVTVLLYAFRHVRMPAEGLLRSLCLPISPYKIRRESLNELSLNSIL